MKWDHTIFSKCTKNMRLRNQLILIASVQTIIILSYVLALNMVHLSLLSVNFQETSNYLYKENSNRIQSNTIKLYRSYFDKVFYLSKKYISTQMATHQSHFIDYISIQFKPFFDSTYEKSQAIERNKNTLYHFTRKQVLLQNNLQINEAFQMPYGGINQIPDPLRIIKGYGNSDISYCFMCYSNLSSYSEPKTIDELVGIKMQEQVQAYGQLIYQGKEINQYFFYSYIVKEKITSIYPCLNRQQGIYSYKPEQRDWYIELQRNYDQTQNYNSYNYTFTNPYMLFTEKRIGLSTAMPIVNEQGKLIGGLGSIFLGNDFVQEVGQKKFGFQIMYLISNDGIMIMHPYQVSADYLPLYIYNQTITGFNFTDWIEIRKQNGSSSCPKFEIFNSPLQCRFNTVYNQEMIIGIREIPQFKMILIMLSSSQEYLEFYYTFEKQLQDNLQETLSLNMTTLFGLFILACIFIYIMTQILFFPIYVVQDYAANLISQKKKKEKTIPSFILKCMSKQVRILFQSLTFIEYKLQKLSFRKTEQCSFFESIQFPQHNISFHTHLKQYQEFLRNNCVKKVNLFKMEKDNNFKCNEQNSFHLQQILQLVRKANLYQTC